MTLRQKSTTITSTPTQEWQSSGTRPKKPLPPFAKFSSERKSKIMSEVWKEASERWKGMSEEGKRPYVEKYETAIDEKDKLRAQLEAMDEEDKISNKEKSNYTGQNLFYSEVQIPGASGDFIKMAHKMWKDLSPEEKKVYNERARMINEKGQRKIFTSTIKKMMNNRGPTNPYRIFISQILSKRQKEAHFDIRMEWSELSDEEKEKYVKQYEVENQLYKSEMEEYKARDTYGESKRNLKVIKAKIKQTEEDMQKPQLLAYSVFQLFLEDKKESLKGKNSIERYKNGSDIWHALTEEERMSYKFKWSKLKADWQTDVDEWEKRNADNPKMTELRAYKTMLDTGKKQG